MSIDVANTNQEGDIWVMSEWKNCLLWHLLWFLHSWIFSVTKSDILTDRFPPTTKITCSDRSHSFLIVRLTAIKLTHGVNRMMMCNIFHNQRSVVKLDVTPEFTCYLKFNKHKMRFLVSILQTCNVSSFSAEKRQRDVTLITDTDVNPWQNAIFKSLLSNYVAILSCIWQH